MNLYLWENIEHVSGNYHSGGGLVAVAESIQDIEGLLLDHPEIKLTEKEWTQYLIFPLHGKRHEKRIIVFPDAGCC